tara:strand:+ start:78 stop:383 length:306 start_codon:yes stop_codon:yes gene_type:complete
VKKKNRHSNPANYRIRFQAGGFTEKSTQYYSVYHSSEALDDIIHTFDHGKIHANKITIYKIEEWNRFTKKWIDRTDKAIEHAEKLNGVLVDNKIILKRKKK